MICKNDMSYYLPKVNECGFNIPNTNIYKLDENWIKWLRSDNYSEEKIKEFNEYLLDLFKNLDLNKKYFIKTGNFSNKFNFNDSCLVVNKEDFGTHFLTIYYGSMLVDCQESQEIVIRDFIETKYNRKSIYNGMKLNTEFRVFYDFSNNEFLGIFNYWNADTMKSHLKDNELEIFKSEEKNINEDFENLKNKLKEYILNDCKLENSELKGTWSIDFLWDGDKFWMIDMALAKNSYYYNLVVDKDKNKMIDDEPVIYTEEEKEEIRKFREKQDQMMKEFFEKMKNKNK